MYDKKNKWSQLGTILAGISVQLSKAVHWGTQTLEKHLGTRVLKYLSTWALEARYFTDSRVLYSQEF